MERNKIKYFNSVGTKDNKLNIISNLIIIELMIPITININKFMFILKTVLFNCNIVTIVVIIEI